MSSRRVGTGCDPYGHGSGRPNVAQRVGDRSTGRDSAGPDLIEAPVQRLREAEVQECPSAQTALPSHIGDFAAAASIASSTLVESRENPFYGSPHRRLPMSLLLRGGLVVTQDEKRRVVTGDLLLEDGRIVAVGDVDRSADDVIDCSGCAVLPGFINLHQHVANTLLRGVADDVPLEEMLLRASAIDAKLTRRDVQIGALLGCVEMIRSGTTSFHDLFYWEDEVARAARESGMRGFLSWVTLDDAFTTQHGSPLKNADAFVAKQKDDPLVTPSVGVQGVYVASEETYAKAKEIADRRDVRLHTHLSETRGEVEAHRKKTGLRPVEWLEKIGFLGERVTAAHCTWVTMNEVRALARCGVSVAHCPVSNMKLASGGVAPVPEMLEAGVVARPRAASPLSNNRIVVVGGIQGAPPLAKATPGDARGKPAQTVLDLATIHPAPAVPLEGGIGSIEGGKRAGLAVVSLKGAHTTPFYPESVIRHLVYSGRGSDVRATIVDGKVLMAGGVVRTVDEGGGIARAPENAPERFAAGGAVLRGDGGGGGARPLS